MSEGSFGATTGASQGVKRRISLHPSRALRQTQGHTAASLGYDRHICGPTAHTEGARTARDDLNSRISMLPRWKRRAIGLAFFLLLAILLGLWLRPRSQPIAPLPSVLKTAPASPPATGSVAAAPKVPPQAQSALPTIDICGLGKVPVDGSDPVAVAQYLREYTDGARRRWLSALLDSDNLRARAAGLFVNGMLLASGAPHPSVDQARDALVQLAVGASDPAIYALAVSACNTYGDRAPTGSCRQVSLAAWTRMDTNNAVPWLLLAGQAHERNDAVTEAAAFAQAAKAQRVDAYNDKLYAFAESELPRDVTPSERWYLVVEFIGIESALPLMHFASASKHCSSDAMKNEDVRAQCSALAELLVSKGTTLVDFSLGTHLGARAGWAPARVAGLTDQFDALMQAVEQTASPANDDSWSCDSVNRGNALLGQSIRLGEIGAARDALERSGETVAEWAQKHRDFVSKMSREAQRRGDAAPSEPRPGGDLANPM